jgi:two-component system, cell cycle sensor histidine kinase and response regulator CckA
MQGMLQRLIGEDIAIVLDGAPDVGHVRADPRQIEQVILNLAVNARDAMPDGGTFTISLRNLDVDTAASAPGAALAPGRYVVLAVTDTGHGMDRATRERVFEPFFTTKAPDRGTGLGLATAYGVVQQSGGRIVVESEPGQGARFTIYLPRVDAPARPRTVAAEPARVSGGTETILVVEDEPALRAITRRMLAGAGYTVLEAGNGTEALALVAALSGPLDLLLTDVVLPGMSGRQLAERLTAVRPATRTLFMSGYTDDAILRHGVLEEPGRLVSKPFSPAGLRRRVRDALDA